MEELNNIQKINKIDKSNMLSLLSDFSAQCREVVDEMKKIEVPERYKKKNYENIFFAGMGGSAIGAHILTQYLKDELKVPTQVNRDYTIPKFIGEDSLAFFCSYSGNTEETLSCFEKAKQKTSNIIVISSNGKLLRKVKENSFFSIELPSGFPPRAALGYSFFSLLLSFTKLGLISVKEEQINETIEVLATMQKKNVGKKVESSSNIAKKIALKCYRKLPVIYGATDCLEPVVLRWKTQLAENSKMFSTINTLPEMNHNEIVGWEYPKEIIQDFKVIFLRDECEHFQVEKRIEISKKILHKQDIEVIEVNSFGKSLLCRLFSLIYVGDFVSYYLAVLNGTDPTPVNRIDYLKKKLSER